MATYVPKKLRDNCQEREKKKHNSSNLISTTKGISYQSDVESLF